ncbi:MAG: hypothetical protein GTO63_27930 [Anaerolineae bacterium]|nr:hypothetical protein [Anaerolineae bacterium]NIN98575.1 hypothetical protein [Anaerolineae bacterium]NIQ81459.1 hypothetical protein [Anaerolineae bacterium]
MVRDWYLQSGINPMEEEIVWPSAYLLATAAAFAPRLVPHLACIFGNQVKAVFNTWIVPLLGLIFLPQMTIVNVDSASGAGIATIGFLPPLGGGVSLDSLTLVTGHFHSRHPGEKIGWVSHR